MAGAIELFSTAEKAVRELDIPSKEVVQALAKSAMRMVAIDLANNNPKGALDTLDKMDAVESYIKSKVQQEHADQVTQNVIAASRFRIRWEIGGWLKENLHGRGKSKSGSGLDLNKYWLEEVFGSNGYPAMTKSSDWQRLREAFSDLQQLDEYLKPWEDPNNKKVDELMWKHVWVIVKPPAPKAPEEPLEVELTPAGEKFYRELKSLETATIAYVKYLDTNETEGREVHFMIGMMKDTAGNLMDIVDLLEGIGGKTKAG